ncbi:hypothetical protein M3Y96_00488800 [Aphelenchoides besseyi]|nr:hypothetical protein M3Y96_00488800 [Aphelenchoides besseyi]
MAWFRGSNSRSIDSSFPTPRSARPYIPSDMSGNLESMMIDMLLNEIQTHISRLEDEQESLKETRQPDYGWLMDWKLKTKKTLSFRECSAIEMICQKIRPNEWGALIREFRQRVQFIRNRDDVVNTFRAVVDEILNERCASQNSVRLVDELLNSPNSTIAELAREATDSSGTYDAKSTERNTKLFNRTTFRCNALAAAFQRNARNRLTILLPLGENQFHYTRFH